VFSVMLCAVPGFSQQTGAAPQAGTASLSGKITTTTGENTTNNIPGIAVKLTGPAPASTSQTAVSDSDGKYQFIHLAQGSYTLEATVEGFKPETATVTLTSGQAATLDVALQISAVEERVEVQGETTEIATQSVTATATVNEQQLQGLPLRTEKFTEAFVRVPQRDSNAGREAEFQRPGGKPGHVAGGLGGKRGSGVGEFRDSCSG